MRGEVVYFYAFDVANEIVAGRVGTVLGGRPAPLELRLKHAAPKDVAFHRPLAVTPPPLDARLAGQPVRTRVHVYEVGVVSIAFRAAVECAELAELLPFHEPTLEDGRPLDRVAVALCAAVRRDLGGALVRPSPPTEPEAYTAFCLTDPAQGGDVAGWFAGERARVAGLLSGLPPDRLSEAQVAEALRLRWSLEKDDLVVIDWDAALVVDPAGPAEDVLYVLEVANLQLEEFRMMDRALDRSLDRAYGDLERRGAAALFGSTAGVLRKLRWSRVDLSKLADEVTNITKFVGDWYLARVYLGARERFHLDRWRASVEQRLGQLDELYSVARAEVFERRLLWLEVLMAVFFAIDLVAILWWKR
jgi:hypothetical protein